MSGPHDLPKIDVFEMCNIILLYPVIEVKIVHVYRMPFQNVLA
jgi:hypothetical protein